MCCSQKVLSVTYVMMTVCFNSKASQVRGQNGAEGCRAALTFRVQVQRHYAVLLMTLYDMGLNLLDRVVRDCTALRSVMSYTAADYRYEDFSSAKQEISHSCPAAVKSNVGPAGQTSTARGGLYTPVHTLLCACRRSDPQLLLLRLESQSHLPCATMSAGQTNT